MPKMWTWQPMARFIFLMPQPNLLQKKWGTYEASLLDLMEHGGHGRLLVYDPATGVAKTLLDGLNFANGVAVSHNQKSVLVNETWGYRVLGFWIAGPKKGKAETLIGSLSKRSTQRHLVDVLFSDYLAEI